MIKPEAQEFWNASSFERQQELIAGPVPWDVSEKNASLHRTWIETSVVKQYLNAFGFSAGPLVVELGCGVGRMLKEFMADYPCVGLDISENMLKKAEEYLKPCRKTFLELLLINKDGTLPLVDNNTNFIFSFLVFQHIQTLDEIDVYIKEISRVLAPGGMFRVQTLRGIPHPEDHFGGFRGHFYPSLEEFKQAFEKTEQAFDYDCRLRVIEEEEGLGHPDWLWLTLQKER
jgi:ubiquinone/menaquinone biosynthesis C-methylase UbiE